MLFDLKTGHTNNRVYEIKHSFALAKIYQTVSKLITE